MDEITVYERSETEQKRKKPGRRKEVTQYQVELYSESFLRTGNKAKAYKTVFGEDATVDYGFHNRPEVQKQLAYDRKAMGENNPGIMDAEEILLMYSAIARGEVSDQFGLEASLDTRVQALKELGKRYGLASEVIEIKSNDGLAAKMKQARERALNGEKQLKE